LFMRRHKTIHIQNLYRGARMKKVILVAALAAFAATPALAADMLVKKAPPPPPAPTWSWTGFYVGANVGGGWAKSDWFEDVSGSGGGGPAGFQDASINASGVLGGGQIGYDWQTGWAVFGIQADADAAGIRGNNTSCFPEVTNVTQSCNTKIDAMGTVTGRSAPRSIVRWFMFWAGLPGSTNGSLIPETRFPLTRCFRERELGLPSAPDLKGP
jgi:opacity protein-like surface antigen